MGAQTRQMTLGLPQDMMQLSNSAMTIGANIGSVPHMEGDHLLVNHNNILKE
jgi:hypothetical protein